MARAPLEEWFPTQLMEISYIGEEVEGRVAKGLSDPTRETLTIILSVTLWRALVRFTPSGPRCCGAWTLAPRTSWPPPPPASLPPRSCLIATTCSPVRRGGRPSSTPFAPGRVEPRPGSAADVLPLLAGHVGGHAEQDVAKGGLERVGVGVQVLASTGPRCRPVTGAGCRGATGRRSPTSSRGSGVPGDRWRPPPARRPRRAVRLGRCHWLRVL